MLRLFGVLFIVLSGAYANLNTAYANLDSDITAITRDRQGFIWYAGQFGLKQLVGTKKVDMLSAGVASELGIIRDITFTENDLLLATKHQGIWSYRENRSLYRPTMEGQSLWVKDLLYNSTDQYTLALGNSFIARLSLDGEVEVIYQSPNISFLRALAHDGQYYILSSRGIFTLDNNKLKPVNDTYAYDIIEWQDQLVLATPNGLALLHSDNSVTIHPAGVSESIFSLTSTPEGILAGATNAYFEVTANEVKRKPLSQCGRVPRLLYQSEVFIGCQQGLIVINRHETTAKSLSAATLITADKEALWLATAKEGIGKLTATGIEYLEETAAFLRNHLLYDMEKIGDKIYIGADRGAFAIDVRQQTLTPLLDDMKIHAILAFGDGVLLGGYENFLASYDGEQIKRIELDRRITTVIDLQVMGEYLLLSDDNGVFKLDSNFKVVDFLPTALTTNTVALSSESFIAITHGKGALKVNLSDFSSEPLVNSNLAKNLSNDYFIFGQRLENKLFIYHRGGYGYFDLDGNHWVNISTEPTTFIRRPLAVVKDDVFFSDNLQLVQYMPAKRQPFHVSVPLIRENFVTSKTEAKHFKHHGGMFLAIGGSNAYTEEELNNVQYAWQFDEEPLSGKSFESSIPMHTSPQSLFGAKSMGVQAYNFTTGQHTRVRLPFSVSVHSLLAPKALLMYTLILALAFTLFAYLRRAKQAELERADKLAYFDLKKYHQNINSHLGKIVSGLDHVKNVILIPSSDQQKQEFHQIYRDIMARIRTVAQHFNQPFSYDLNTALQELAAEARQDNITLLYSGEEALEDLDRKVENALYTVLREVVAFFIGQNMSQEIRTQFKLRTSLGYSHRVAVSIQSALPKHIDEYLFSQFRDALKGKMHRYMGSLQSLSYANDKFILNLEFRAVKNHVVAAGTDNQENAQQPLKSKNKTDTKSVK